MGQKAARTLCTLQAFALTPHKTALLEESSLHKLASPAAPLSPEDTTMVTPCRASLRASVLKALIEDSALACGG